MLLALLILAAIVLFALAGLNVQRPRFAPQWWAFACLTAAAFHTVLAAVA